MLNANIFRFRKKSLLKFSLIFIGFGKFHIAMLLISGIIIMAVFNETMGMMIIVPAAQCDLKLGPKEKGFLGAIGFIGLFCLSNIYLILLDLKFLAKKF